RESREKQTQNDILQQLTPKIKRAKFLPKPENVACRSILTSCRVGSAGTSSARGKGGGPRRFTEVVRNEQSLPVAWWSHDGREQWPVASEIEEAKTAVIDLGRSRDRKESRRAL